MPTMEIPAASIELRFQGLMIITADRRGASGQNALCRVHVLDNVPEHTLRVHVQRKEGDVWRDIREPYTKHELDRVFSLQVDAVDIPGISFAAPFSNEVVDFEGHLYKKSVSLQSNGIHPIFRFNSGRFRTVRLSDQQLVVSRGRNGVRRNFRHVSVIIAADIALDLENSSAVFVNRADTFTFRPPGPACRICVINDDDRGGEPTTDHAEFYNQVIATDEPEEEKYHFHRSLRDEVRGQDVPGEEAKAEPAQVRPAPAAAPHAICFTAMMGDGVR